MRLGGFIAGLAATVAIALLVAGSVWGPQSHSIARLTGTAAPFAESLMWLGNSANGAQARIRSLEDLRGPQLAALPKVAPATSLNVTGSHSIRPLATQFSSQGMHR